jgi:light-regulated signal transduction histidine kinase (bacteriophytochrome)
LFRAIIVERNARGCQSKGECTLEALNIAVLVQEPGVIVVVDEDAESVEVSEVTSNILPSGADVIHGLTSSINVLDCIVHRVVEQAGDVILVWTNIGRVTVEDLTHLENTG